MMPTAIDIRRHAEAVIYEVSTVLGVLNEKGRKRFGRTFLLSGFMIFAAYSGLYTPPQQKSELLGAEIKKAKTTFEYATQYKDLRDQLAAACLFLPSISEREQWLTNSVRDSLNAGGLVTDDFKPLREEENTGLIFQTSTVSVNLRFSEFYDWLLRLESAKPMMHLLSMNLTKKGSFWYNAATFEIGTIVPKKRYR